MKPIYLVSNFSLSMLREDVAQNCALFIKKIDKLPDDYHKFLSAIRRDNLSKEFGVERNLINLQLGWGSEIYSINNKPDSEGYEFFHITVESPIDFVEIEF